MIALPRPTLPHRLITVTALVACLVALGCSGGGSSSPTDPGPPGSGVAGTASLTGEVSVAGGSLTGSAGSVPSTPSGPTFVAAASRSGAGTVVRVQGTSLATTADAEGRFSLGGVPHGNQVVVFEAAGASAALAIDGIQPRETIRVAVKVTGSQAEIEDMDRDGGDAEDEPEDDEPDAPGDDKPDEPDDPAGEPADLALEISPSTWNVEYEHSSGTVAAFLRGAGFERIDLDSILFFGDDPSDDPVSPVSASRQGNHVRARFAKRDVIEALEDPGGGSLHTIVIQLTLDDGAELVELTAQVRVEGKDEEDDEPEDAGEPENLSLELSPASWNLNYGGSSGTVTAFIRGSGLASIDLDSIELVGDDPEAAPLPASFARLEGNHVRAQFPKAKVLGLLDAPAKGTTHEVTVRFTGAGDDFELTATVKVVGNG